MTNPKDPDGSRFALVVVGSSEEMSACIAEFDKCELQGRIIHVEKVQFLHINPFLLKPSTTNLHKILKIYWASCGESSFEMQSLFIFLLYYCYLPGSISTAKLVFYNHLISARLETTC